MARKLMGRRDFVKSSIAGLGGFDYLSSNEKKEEKNQKEKKFEGDLTRSRYRGNGVFSR